MTSTNFLEAADERRWRVWAALQGEALPTCEHGLTGEWAYVDSYADELTAICLLCMAGYEPRAVAVASCDLCGARLDSVRESVCVWGEVLVDVPRSGVRGFRGAVVVPVLRVCMRAECVDSALAHKDYLTGASWSLPPEDAA